MYFTIKAIFRTLLLPPASPLILGLIGLLLLRRHRRWGMSLLIVSELAIFLFSTPFLAAGLTRLAEHYPALDLSQPTHAQAVVIIGGGGLRTYAPEYGGPAPDYLLLHRVSYGAFVAKRTGLPLLVSGAPGEVLAMRTSLERDFGLTVRWVEGESRDTFENARFTAHILLPEGITRIVLVTMGTQMYRATQEFRGAGFDVVPAPTGVQTAKDEDLGRFVPSAGALLLSSLAVYELLGEQARRLQAALGVRERFDTKAASPSVRSPDAARLPAAGH
jgi:uncharacterized SAM-binding protein YcdF (DUF218 family)